MTYHEILGVKKGASTKAIKRAYRLKAKKYHPDINTSLSSKEEFLKISEAYEFLINYKPTQPRFNNSLEKKEWNRKTQDEIRKKAAYYANLKKKDFLKSNAYRIDKAEMVVYNHLQFFFASYIFLGLIPTFYLIGGDFGAAVGTFFWIALWAVWTSVFQNYKLLSWSEFSDSFKILRGYNGFWTFFYSIVIVLCFSLIVMNTSIFVIEYLLIVFTTSTLSYFIYNNPIIGRHSISLGNKLLFPLFLFSVLLSLNFYIPAFDIKNEDVTFYRGVEYYSSRNGGGGYHSSTEAYFGNGDFSKYFLVRFFPVEEVLEQGNCIKYKSHRGILGLKVLREYEIHTCHSN